SDRKLRLLAVACCRRHWHLLDTAHCVKLVEVGERLECRLNPTGLPLDSCQRALELAERVADAPVSANELAAAREAADAFHAPAGDYAACYVKEAGPFDSELMAAGNAAYAVYYACDPKIDISSAGGAFLEMAAAVAYVRSSGFGRYEKGGDSSERAAQ